MQPNRLGRVLGIGTRVAASKLRDGTAGAVAAAQRSSASRAAERASTAPGSGSADRTPGYAEGSRRLARGAGRFGSALWGPFAHATGVLTLQIAGVFFALFTAFFALHAWQAWKSAGAHDRHVLVYAAFALLFAWFTVSSFVRASRKPKQS